MRRISAQKFYARVNDNGAYIIDPSQHNYNPEWPEIHVRAISERDYRLLTRVAKLATIWERECRTIGYREANWLAMAEAVRAFNFKRGI